MTVPVWRTAGPLERFVRGHVAPIDVTIARRGGMFPGWGWHVGGDMHAMIADTAMSGRELLEDAVRDAAKQLSRWRTLRILTCDTRLVRDHSGPVALDGVEFVLDVDGPASLNQRLNRHPDVVRLMKQFHARMLHAKTRQPCGVVIDASVTSPGVDAQPTVRARRVTVACDGSFNPLAGVGAWAWRTGNGSRGSGVALAMSATMCELEAIVCALEHVDACTIKVLSDCESLVAPLNRLVATGVAPKTHMGKSVDGRELWERARAAVVGRNIVVTWVRGHNGHGLQTPVDIEARRVMRDAVRALEAGGAVAETASLDLIAV